MGIEGKPLPLRRTILQALVTLVAGSCKPGNWLAMKAESARGVKWLAFYGETADEQELSRYDLVVLDPMFKGSKDVIAHAGARLCGYLSLGEISTTDPRYGQIDPAALLEANPGLYLDELQEQLFSMRDKDVSLATISWTIQRLAMSHKHILKTALERNELLRATWQAEYGDIPAKYFVWLDKSSVDDKTNQRNQGWADLGRACVRRATFIRGQRYSVLPAFTADGFIALDIFEGSVNKDRFIRFLNEELVRSKYQLSIDLNTQPQ